MFRAFRSRKALSAVLWLVPAALLGGCGGGDTVQEALGYEQAGPDEMAVIKRPPLIVPPDYNLRPPSPGDRGAAGRAASESARKTLIGPSSEIGASPAETADSRAILTGGTPANDAAGDDAATSDGQNLLVNRTDRTERDLEELVEDRAENRVDGALLRRLLAWTPEERAAESDGEDAGEPVVVEVIARSQTSLDTITPSDNPNDAE